jgi:putative restriction endonuclease
MEKGRNVVWSRQHFLIALNLYCKLPFGKLHRGNPLIVAVAGKMARTPSSLAMKLSNFASLDPVQRARGVRGLTGATRKDRQMWDEFHANISELGAESEQLLHDLFTSDNDEEVDFLTGRFVRLEHCRLEIPAGGPTESLAVAKVRRGQQFFRQAILNAYALRCCVSGIDLPRLLVASHIKPWSDFPAHRLDPRNGLCLSSLHDAAFDGGLMTLDEASRVVVSRQLRDRFSKAAFRNNFSTYEGRRIDTPRMLGEPSPEFLQYHRENIFVGS